MESIRELISIVEAKEANQLTLDPLPAKDLNPVISDKALAYHLKLAKGYVTRYNSGEGDATFNQAGAFLHNTFFSQFKEADTTKPYGSIMELIEDKYASFDEFKDEFTDVAMSIQGSGWCYLDKNGSIKTIANHKTKPNIVILVDMWEHAWALDYESRKDLYLKNIWKILDWDLINQRLV